MKSTLSMKVLGHSLEQLETKRFNKLNKLVTKLEKAVASKDLFFTAKVAKFFRKDLQSILSLRSLRFNTTRSLRLNLLLRQPLFYKNTTRRFI